MQAFIVFRLFFDKPTFFQILGPCKSTGVGCRADTNIKRYESQKPNLGTFVRLGKLTLVALFNDVLSAFSRSGGVEERLHNFCISTGAGEPHLRGVVVLHGKHESGRCPASFLRSCLWGSAARR